MLKLLEKDQNSLMYYVYAKDPRKSVMRSKNDKKGVYLYVPFVSAVGRWERDTFVPKAFLYDKAYEIALNYVAQFHFLSEDRFHQSVFTVGVPDKPPIIGSVYFIDNAEPAYPKVMIQLDRGEQWKYNIIHPVFSPTT